MTENLPTAAPAPAMSEAAQMFMTLMEMAVNPAIDAGKLQALASLQIQISEHSQRQEFNKDKIAALREMPAITKRGQIAHEKNNVVKVLSRYATFEDIMRVVKPILDKHNLVLNFDVDNAGSMVTVQPILSHTNGFVEKGGRMALPLDTTGSKNGTQGAGSAAAYGKRHSAKAMLNIVEDGEDTDGGAGRDPFALTDEEQEWADEGLKAAGQGTASLNAWWAALGTQKKAALVYKKVYQDLKKGAEAHD